MTRTNLTLASLFVALPLWAADPALLKSEFIYETAPFPSCHASTIVETTDGSLLAAWFGGTDEKHPDVGIWVSRLEGGRWSPPVEVANGVQYRKSNGAVVRHPTWNPVLFQPTDGPLMLFYKVGPSPQTWWGMLMTSVDNGKRWSHPCRLPEGIFGPIKNKPVQLVNGDILCPTSNETDERPSKWAIYFERTHDLGRTWERTDLLHDGVALRAIQPSVLFLGGDRLMALGRTREGKIFRTQSDDAGSTWGPLTLTELPNPNSGTDAVTLKDGRHLLVYNHTRRGRSPLNVAVSPDGETWHAALVLENEPGEYSYPAVIQARNAVVHVTYTWKRQKVRHVAIDPSKLSLRPIVNGEWPK
ncbi:MAG: exo-alpha-sialidase [Verrucomicrobiia bacterium]